MKTIEDAVIRFDGLWQECFDVGFAPLGLTRSEFEACAKRMGYINGYRWGVEYPTNGKRPDLEDDVDIEYKNGFHGDSWVAKAKVGHVYFCADSCGVYPVTFFRITDLRYKPADTSYLNEQPKSHTVKANEMVVNARKCWPPVAGMTVELWHGGQYIEDVEFLCERGGNVIFWRYSNDSVDSAVMPTAELRPIKSHREKVIEAAKDVCNKVPEGESVLDYLFDAGMLVLPGANCNTKD